MFERTPCAHADDKTGRVENKTGRADDKTGRVESKTGRADDKTGHVESKTGRADDRRGRADNKTGRADDKAGHAESKTGRADDRRGSADSKTGRVDDRRKARARRWSSAAIREGLRPPLWGSPGPSSTRRPAPAVTYDAGMADIGSAPCTGCGYDLGGIDAQRCPECGIDRAEPPRVRRGTALLGLIAGGLTTVPAVLAAMIAVGPCGGSSTVPKAILPLPMILAGLVDDISMWPMLLLAVVQFSLYGLAAGVAVSLWGKRQRMYAALLVALIPAVHAVATLVCFSLN